MSEITVAISVLSAVVGMASGIFTGKRLWKQDIENRSRQTATIISELGYVKAGIDDIKRRQEKMDEKHYTLAARVAKMEGTAANHIM